MIIGIDLGTTNSLVSYYNGDIWQLIPNEFGDVLTPSVISVNDDGSYDVGKIAKEKIVTHPNQTFYNFKRTMGSDFKYKYKRFSFSSELLSSILLKYLVEQAEKYLGEKVTEAIVTVPAYFDDRKRIETKNAGIIAGIKVERLINEPSAAALAYHQLYNLYGYFLIFDFGGGTLDISVVDVFKNVIDVLAVVGDNRLGGSDIDQLIASHFQNQFSELKKISDFDFQNLCQEAEKMKIELSDLSEKQMIFNYHDHTYSYAYTPQLLMEICEPILFRIRSLIVQGLKDANIEVSELTAVIGVGGSSKVTFVKQYLERLTRLKPSMEIEPQEVVAIGAGIVSSIKERREKVKDMILTDVCPFSLGVDIIDNNLSIIIPRNTTLPSSITKRYVTVEDNQSRVDLQILQGENPRANKNIVLDILSIDVEELPRGQAQADVTFTYDINGILNVTVKSNIDKKEKIVFTNNLVDQELIARKKAELAKLSNKQYQDPQVEYLISYADKVYYNASNENKPLIADLINWFTKIIERNKPTQILRAMDDFKERLEQFERNEFVVTLYDEVDELNDEDPDDQDIILN